MKKGCDGENHGGRMTNACDPGPLRQAAAEYLRRGWMPVFVPPGQKGPKHPDWQKMRLTAEDIPKIFATPGNIGLILGEASGGLTDVDLDCSEAIELANQFLPSTRAITGREMSPGSHRWYVVAGANTRQFRDPRTKKMVVEIRSTGAQTLVGPSIHPAGDRYEALREEPAVVEAQELENKVEEMYRFILKLRYGELAAAPRAVPPAAGVPDAGRAGAPSDKGLATVGHPPSPLACATGAPRWPGSEQAPQDSSEQRAIAYLNAMPPAISGQGGHSALYAAATALVHGFAIPTGQAFEMLWTHYNPRCIPPWSEKELQHKVEEAATKPHNRPAGWLRDGEANLGPMPGFAHGKQSVSSGPEAVQAGSTTDPGLIPTSLLRVPGFISEVMDLTLETAPYPNPVLAFCGALALQAFLAGRKVRDPSDNRTNLLLLGLAHSASGKDWPRKINSRVLFQSGMLNCLGEGFASAEGIQDALFAAPSMLFQTDEMDGILQSITKSKDARYENIMTTFLTLYSSANSVFPMRRKAGKTSPGVIDQPCLVLFGTAIPNHYYDAISERMLTNGFFARMLILEAGKRSKGQNPKIPILPARILETVGWWGNFRPGLGNLENWHPSPKIVDQSPEAQKALLEARQQAEAEYGRAEEKNDPVGTTVWGRAMEHTCKLALLYAVSERHDAPLIGQPSVEWATSLVRHQTRRMLFMAQEHVADNPFQAECLKLIRKLRESPQKSLDHSVLLRRMKLDAESFHKVITTLTQRGDVEVIENRGQNKGWPPRTYRLAYGATLDEEANP